MAASRRIGRPGWLPGPVCPSLLFGLSLLGGCTVGPDYLRPDMFVPAAFKEAPKPVPVVRAKGWKTAEPGDSRPRGAWWTAFGDPTLNDLAAAVETGNQSLKATEAAWRQAQAVIRADRAGLFPELGLSGSATRSGTGAGASSSGRSSATSRLSDSLAATWELDFWGRVRRQVEADTAASQASAADLANARLSAQGSLVVAYLQLRAEDERKRLLDETVEAYRRSATIVRNQRDAGIAAEADVAQAETQLRSAEAQAIATGLSRAQYEHAIAVLVGKAPADLAVKPSMRVARVPAIPPGVPSELLERRPDIAAAERDVAAANARIGVAEAAFYPTLTLSASVGTQGSAFADLLRATNGVWSLGPAALAQTVFDAGARSAVRDQRSAAYDGTVATYRQTVLSAFQEVEDQLAALRVLARQIAAQQDVVQLAQRAVELTLNQYRAGTIAYSTVITAQATALSARENLISLRLQRQIAAADLIVALGGGWDAGQLPAQ